MRKPKREQLALKTQCGHCSKTFPDPTQAATHVAKEHRS